MIETIARKISSTTACVRSSPSLTNGLKLVLVNSILHFTTIVSLLNHRWTSINPYEHLFLVLSSIFPTTQSIPYPKFGDYPSSDVVATSLKP